MIRIEPVQCTSKTNLTTGVSEIVPSSLSEAEVSSESWSDTFLKTPKGYSPYHEDMPVKVAHSFEEIPRYVSHCSDARATDISRINLSEEQLIDLISDRTTVMNTKQKAIVDKYSEKMKDPGLGIRALHKKGITGKGIKIAIIDQPLGEHEEYNQNIVGRINDINCKKMGWTKASMHGAAVSSIAVGKTVGVAPDAKLSYYSAVNLSKNPKDIEEYKNNLRAAMDKYKGDPGYEEFVKQEIANIERQQEEGTAEVSDNRPYAQAINKILDENKKLPKNEQVSVISISWGFNEFAPGYKDVEKAVERAKKEGVFVVSCALDSFYPGMETCGANRDPKADPNDSKSYEAGAFYKARTEEGSSKTDKNKLLLFPMDHRTVADYRDKTSYQYCGNDGGMSWSTPWIAGLYALAKQTDANITPEKFWDLALKTSDKCCNNDSGKHIAQIVNPSKLIEEIQRMKCAF